MRVTITIGGKWHSLPLAEQLEKRGLLHRVVTSHPHWAYRSPLISPRKIISFPLAEAVGQGINRLTGSNAGDYWKAALFDRFALTQLSDGDVLIGFASFCRTTLARKQGLRGRIVERACPHILDQTQLLREEAGRLGLRFNADRRTEERMLAEYEMADLIVVPSRYSQESFLARGFRREKVLIVPLSGKFPAPAQPPWRDPQAPFRLLFVGGFFLRKGLIYLLRAWHSLRLKNAELILRSSDCPNTPEVRKLLEDPGVRLLKQRQDLSRLYSEASAFCLPSIDDGFGMVVLEAMSYGLPVIVTQNVGSADCLREGTDGFIVKIRDAEALKEKILDLYEHPEKRLQMGRSAMERARSFTWESYGGNYAQALRPFEG